MLNLSDASRESEITLPNLKKRIDIDLDTANNMLKNIGPNNSVRTMIDQIYVKMKRVDKLSNKEGRKELIEKLRQEMRDSLEKEYILKNSTRTEHIFPF